MRLLVVEDAGDVADAITARLSRHGHVCDKADTLDEARQLIAVQPLDLIILDINLPDGSGFDLVRELRRQGNETPVLVLSARMGVDDRIDALDSGADDYLVKPFEPRELVARVRSILRRYLKAPADALRSDGPRIARFAGWQLDVQRLLLNAPDGREVHLSTAEAALLQSLLRSPNKILNREQLLGDRDVDPFDRSIDVRISRLRRKLEEDPQSPRIIKTIYGAGYMLTTSVSWE